MLMLLVTKVMIVRLFNYGPMSGQFGCGVEGNEKLEPLRFACPVCLSAGEGFEGWKGWRMMILAPVTRLMNWVSTLHKRAQAHKNVLVDAASCAECWGGIIRYTPKIPQIAYITESMKRRQGISTEKSAPHDFSDVKIEDQWSKIRSNLKAREDIVILYCRVFKLWKVWGYTDILTVDCICLWILAFDPP